MSSRDNLDELLKVLEEIRKESFPEIPSEIISKIARVQYENQDTRADARWETMQIMTAFLESEVKKGV